MNFTDQSFLLLFLPVTLAVAWAIGRWGSVSGAAGRRQAWLTAASILFYGLSGPWNLALLLVSVAVNFVIGTRLAGTPRGRGLWLLWAAIALNLLPLLFYKVLPLWRQSGGSFLTGSAILIPLSLSFLTFQQIAFIVGCYKNDVQPVLRHYLFFVLFFPQRIMGPILSYPAIERQLKAGRLGSVTSTDVAVGFAIFVFGLAKKLIVADPLGGFVDAIYAATVNGAPPTMAEGWFALIGFQLQLFLDFSAYSEMAIGLARMVGIDFPINFDRPYHAIDRFDLWRRWHITFVLFMRRHVFTPLARQWRLPAWGALAVTAGLSGLWHGLGPTFALWSMMQAALLLAQHFRTKSGARPIGTRLIWAIGSTFLVTCLLGTMFRSPSVGTAGGIYASLLLGDIGRRGIATWTALALLGMAAALVWVLPDAQRLFARYWSAEDPREPAGRGKRTVLNAPARIQFDLGLAWGLGWGLLLLWAVLLTGGETRFIYEQF